MKLNVRELIVGGPSRLRFVFRYSTSRVYHRESVAEHSYYTALYSLFIARWVEENEAVPAGRADSPDNPDGGILLGELLQRALLHDLEEARSGDFPRSFKHSDPELKKILEKASEKALIQILKPLIKEDEVSEGDSEGLGQVAYDLFRSWAQSKDDTPEGAILEFADFLSVLGLLLQEGAGAGNKAILEHVEDMEKYFSKFSSDKFKFLHPLVDQTRDIMMELFHNDKSASPANPVQKAGSLYDAGLGRLGISSERNDPR